jgi:hypothetical protein
MIEPVAKRTRGLSESVSAAAIIEFLIIVFLIGLDTNAFPQKLSIGRNVP